jgi:hypothetical protein
MMLSATRLLAAHMRAQSQTIRSLESSVQAERQRPPWRILGDVERGKGGIDRGADDDVGKRHLVIVEAPALAGGLSTGPIDWFG